MATKKMTQCESMAIPMIKKVQVFETTDGEKFEDEKGAIWHESELVRKDLIRNLICADENEDLGKSPTSEIEDFIISNREALLEILK